MIRFINTILIAGTFLCPGFAYSAAQQDSIDSYIEEQINLTQAKFYYTSPDSLSIHYQPLKMLATKNGRWHMLLYLLTGEAQCVAYFHQFDKMHKLLEKSEILMKQRKPALDKLDPDFVARNMVNFTKGIYHYSIGDYQFAARAFEAVLKADAPFDALGVDYNFSVHSYLGSSYLEMLLFDKAYLHYYKALNTLKKMQDPYLDYYKAMNHMYLGDCKLAMAGYVEKEVLPEALSHYFRAKNILAKKKDDPSFKNAILTAYSQISAIYQSLDKLDSALHYLNLSLEYHSSDDPERIVTYLNYGDVYKDKSNSEEAVRYYKKSLVLADQIYPGNHFRKSLPLFKLSEIFLADNLYDSALKAVEKGLSFLAINGEIDEKVSYKRLLDGFRLKGLVLTEMYKIQHQPDLLKRAINTYLEGVDIIEVVDKQIPFVDYKKYFKAHLQIFYTSAIESVNLAISEGVNRNYYENLLYQLMESNKGTILREAINNTMALQYAGIPEGIINSEYYLKSKAAYLRKLIHENAEDSEKNSWQEDLYKTTTRLDSLLEHIETQYPTYHSMRYDDSDYSLKKVQGLLKNDEVLLEYFWGDSAVYAMGITKNKVVVKRIPLAVANTKDLNQLINICRNNVSKDDDIPDVFASLSYNVFQSFVEPLISQFNKAEYTSLIIVPDGKLAYLPFELLVTTNRHEPESYSQLPYLLRDFSVRNLFSSSFIKDPTSSTFNDHKYAYVGYAPEYKDKETAIRSSGTPVPAFLKYNREEVFKVADYFNSRVFINADATEGNFVKNAGAGRILHLAAHAFTNDEDPSYSGLIFSKPDTSIMGNDGLLHLYEVYNLSINADLVVLSGCETGVGEYSKGEGIISLGRAFRYAGCSNIVMSHWQVNDKSTASIMNEFFHNLKKGMNKSMALRKAKLSFIDDPKNKYFTHPYYWSAFVLVGDAEPVMSNSWSIRIISALVILIVLMVLVIRLVKKRRRTSV